MVQAYEGSSLILDHDAHLLHWGGMGSQAACLEVAKAKISGSGNFLKKIVLSYDDDAAQEYW